MSLDNQPAKDRYPGLCSFEADEHRIFFGRSRETTELLQLVRAEQLVVLFSKSGLGKSSLLSAGLFPKLTPLGFRPIRVRFQQENTRANPEPGSSTPLLVLLATIQEQWVAAYQQAGVPVPDINIPYDAVNPRLWEQMQARPFPGGIVPVLVFDQFEEFFAYPVADQQAFASQLAELMHEQAPARVINWLLDLSKAERTPQAIAWSRQPPVKCVFAIRSDRLAEMHSLKPYLTLILRNRYELGPLREEAARDAIDLPAQLPQAEGPYSTPSFLYNPAVREEILRTLCNDNCEVEGSQLQIVCQHVESCMKEQFEEVDRDPDRFRAIVDRSVISGEREITRVLDKFYRTQLRTIGNVADRVAASNVLENELVEGGRRVGLSKAKMMRLLGDFPDERKETIIQRLQLARLVRCEITHLGETYELSHDSLIEPVEKVRNLREALRKRRAFHEENVRKDRELREQAFRLQQETKAKEAAIRQEREKDAQLHKILALQLANKELLTRANYSRKKYKKLTYFFALVFVVAALAFVYWLRASQENSRLYRGVVNASAMLQYQSGRHAVAFRLWDDIDSTSRHAFAPYVGKKIQVDTNQHYVAVQYSDDTIHVYQQRSQRPDKISYRINALGFTMGGNTLALYQRDNLPGYIGTTVQFSNLKTARIYADKPIPVSDDRNVTLSANGQYAILTGPDGQVHLYRLTGQTQAEITGFAESLASIGPTDRFLYGEFTPASTYLIVNTAQNRTCIYDLQKKVMVTVLTDVATHKLDDSGNWLAAVTLDRRLRLVDLQRRTDRVANLTLKPFAVAQIDAFLPERSTMVISTFSSDEDVNDKGKQLYIIDLRTNRQVLFVNQVVDYRLFRGAGQLGYVTRQNPNQTVRYDLNNQRIGQVLNMAVEPIATGQSHGLFQRANGQLTVRDVRRNTTIPLVLPRITSGTTTEFKFYAPDGITDTYLIARSADSIEVFDLKSRQKSLIRRQKAMKQFGALSLAGNLLQVRMQDRQATVSAEEYWCYFIDNRKNQPEYLRQFVYPELTTVQRSQFGIPDRSAATMLLAGLNGR